MCSACSESVILTPPPSLPARRPASNERRINQNQPIQVHSFRASQDHVNSVILALPRPRPRARSGPLSAVAELALSSATVPKRWVERRREGSQCQK